MYRWHKKSVYYFGR